jgi:hypothetical protein
MNKLFSLDEFTSLYNEFEEIVRQILVANKFTVETPVRNSYDFLAKLDNTFAYVEVKLYTNILPRIDLLRKACDKLLSQKDNENVKLLLIVSSYVTPSLKDEIFKEFGIIIWDIKTLFALAFDHAEIYYDLESILVQTLKTQISEYTIIDRDFKTTIIPSLVSSKTTVKQKSVSTKGADLCKELNKIKPGRDEATLYENKCIEILKYLFDNKTDLSLWAVQNITDEGLYRNDLLCRIISYKKNFWEVLSNDFHTRYVIFEFKNYRDKIKQGQIFTTEKYLFLTALRSVSFIIARVGADENAIKAAKGALKEAGKLIVILNNEDICKMLILKDNGDEPSIVLRQMIDEILIKLNR